MTPQKPRGRPKKPARVNLHPASIRNVAPDVRELLHLEAIRKKITMGEVLNDLVRNSLKQQ